MSRIASDIMDLIGQRTLTESRRVMNTALERLATGKRINRAADDPAGLIAANNLSVQAKKAEREIAALERTNKRLDATEGGLGVVSDLLVELQGLVVEAANTGGKDKSEREALQTQATSIVEAINYVSQTTVYDGEQILLGSHSSRLGSQKWMEWTESDAGPQPEQQPGESLQTYMERRAEWTLAKTPKGVEHTLTLADLVDGKSLNLVDGDLETAQKAVEYAINEVATTRAFYGSAANSNRSRIRALSAEFESTMAAKSGIEDADFAREVSELVRSQILGEASIRSILIGRQQAASALNLL